MKLIRGIPACVVAVCALSLVVNDDVSLAKTDVSTHTRVQLSVAPIPTIANPSPGTPQVAWSTGDGSPGQVTVSVNGGKETLFASESDGSIAAPWLAPGQAYVFRLYSTASGRRLLARLKVGRAPALAVVALPQMPNITSPVVNLLLQLLSFGAVPFLVVLAAMHTLELKRNG